MALKKTVFAICLIVAGASGTVSAHAAPAPAGTDCPLARQPYSLETPVIDLLIDPRTRTILNRAMGGTLDKMPSQFISAKPPTFATIISVKELLALSRAKDTDATLARLSTELKAVPLTPAAMLARCARYDRVPPTLPKVLKHPAILLFDKITGFRDSPSVDAANVALKQIAAKRGWQLYETDNGAIFNPRDLARFDAVVWNNVSGDALTLPQRAAFQAYLGKGGGFAGFHGSGGDPLYIWDWYADTLIGARFIGHPMAPQFQQGRVVVDDQTSAITRGLGSEWTMTEEWYSFKTSPRTTGAHVLVSLDETGYNPVGYGGQNLRMGDHPLAWTRCIGNGRSFYSAIGHRIESYTEPHSIALLEQGIEWAAGLGETRCNAGRERPR